jgi:hypothetical protein
MFALAAAFARTRGRCDVPTNWTRNRRLGRWVAAQRHRRKINRLSPVQVRRLEKIGFVWSPSDGAWERMFRVLQQFKKRHGHCNVPSRWRGNSNLASWVANQRHRNKLGILEHSRRRQMDRLGFIWSIYRNSKVQRAVRLKGRQGVRPASRRNKVSTREERLYNTGGGEYVQYGGKGRKPERLLKYMAAHRNQLPPYIPLPAGSTVFLLGDSAVKKPRRVPWRGCGRLSREVLEYVNENGVLPPHA